MDMVSQETMMFKFGNDENKAETVIRNACAAMEEKGYNPINQLVGYLLSGDPAYVTSHNDARSKWREMSCWKSWCALIWRRKNEEIFRT